RSLGLYEQIEHFRKHLRLDPDSRVLDADARLSVFAVGSERDPAARLGVLRSVDQEIRHRLVEPLWIDDDWQPGVVDARGQSMRLLVEQGARRRGRAGDHLRDLDTLRF